MTPSKKPVLINAVPVMLLLKSSYMFTRTWEYPIYRFGWGSVGIVFLSCINFIAGTVRNRRADGPFYLLMAGVLLLIGFSICSGTFL